MSIRSGKVLKYGLAAGALLASGLANASIVSLCGPNICYEYDNNPVNNAGLALFGAPTLLGATDVLIFTPTNFNADSSSATTTIPGPTVVGVFQFTKVYSQGGSEIAAITVAESGDYQIQGAGSVVANLRLQVVDQVNDTPLPVGVLPGQFPEKTAPQFNWNTSVPTGALLQNWSLNGTVNPAAAFTDLASVVDLQIQNTLQAFAGTGVTDYAFIQKKLTITVTTTLVPVPAAAWLFGSGLGVLGWARRGRKSAA